MRKTERKNDLHEIQKRPLSDVIVSLPTARYERAPSGTLIPFPIPQGELSALCEHEAAILLQKAATGHRPGAIIEASRRDFNRQRSLGEEALNVRSLSLRMCAQFVSYELLSFDRSLFQALFEARLKLDAHSKLAQGSTLITTYEVTAGRLAGTSIKVTDDAPIDNSPKHFPSNIARSLYEQIIEAFPLALENLRSAYRFLQCTEEWGANQSPASKPHMRSI